MPISKFSKKLKSIQKKYLTGHKLKDLLLVSALVAAVFGGLFFLWVANLKIPTLNSFDERKVGQSTKIYDRTGKVVLYDLSQNVTRTVVTFDEISDNIKNAVISIEDQDFYQHSGIRISSILRAIFVNIITLDFSQGGSTITQQVVKKSLLTDNKQISRKIKEWVLALKLEKSMSKKDILSMYLNEIPLGGNIYGVEEASLAFFGKQAKDVDIAEAAYIAAIIQAPTRYSPYGNHIDELTARKNLVLKKMKDLKHISEDEYKNALDEKVEFKQKEDRSIKAPHFVMYIRELLAEKYGEEVLANGGLKVITTLDYSLQQKAESIVKQYALENTKKFNASNAGLVATDPRTGQILAMVGSRNFFDKEIQGQYNVTLAHRQPGSSFKPFVYAAAFNKGYTPDTVLFDVPTEFSTNCTVDSIPLPGHTVADCYNPGNYDNLFRGPMKLRDALAQSINLPAVKLLYLVGIDDALSTAHSLGITTLGDKNQYGLTLVLGGGEVSLLEMTNAYGTFANQGVRNPVTGILKIETNKGDVLEEFQPSATRVLSEETSLKIDDILSDNIARTPSYGSDSPLFFSDRQVAVKTGTTNDYKDTWILGFTPSIAVGVWAGNNDHSSMAKKVAGYIVAPMWRAFMNEALKTLPAETFPKPPATPQDIKPILRGVWNLSDNAQPLSQTNTTTNATATNQTLGRLHEILYWIDKNDPLGPAPANPDSDPQFKYWEYGVQKWAAQNGY